MLLAEDNSHQEQQSGSFSAKIEAGPGFREVRKCSGHVAPPGDAQTGSCFLIINQGFTSVTGVGLGPEHSLNHCQ